MAAATSVLATFGRTAPPFANLAVIPVTFTTSATAYATATGGMPIDLTVALTAGAQPFDMAYINPSDVVGCLGMSLSSNGYIVNGLVVGTPTYSTTASYPNVPVGGTSTYNVPQTLATCPATVRLYGTGAANAAALAEIADGNITCTFTIYLVVARNGINT